MMKSGVMTQLLKTCLERGVPDSAMVAVAVVVEVMLAIDDKYLAIRSEDDLCNPD